MTPRRFRTAAGAGRDAAARVVILFFLVAGLGACSRLATRPPALETGAIAATGIDSALYRSRVDALASLGDWQFSGRIAFASPEDSGSGRIDWEQQGERIDIRLSAPVSRQSWRLTADGSGARLEGLEDGPRRSGTADELLADQFGFDVPLPALAQWLRGLAAEGPVDEAHIDERGRPLELRQHGWVIRFPDWHSMAPADLPRRVFAERAVSGGNDRVRVVIDRWQGHGDAD